MNILAIFKEWRERSVDLRTKLVAQSLRPHNTTQGFVIGLYVKEWFYCYPKKNELIYSDPGLLLDDINARFPGESFNVNEFTQMLTCHYRIVEDTGIAFDRADFFAPYAHATSFHEIEQAKAYYPQLKQSLYVHNH